MPIYTWTGATVSTTTPPAPYVQAWVAPLPAVNLATRIVEWEDLQWVGTMPVTTHARLLLSTSLDGTTWSPYGDYRAAPMGQWVQAQVEWFSLGSQVPIAASVRPWVAPAAAAPTASAPTLTTLRLTYRQVRAWTLGSYAFVTNPTARTRSWSLMANSVVTQGGQYAGRPVNPTQNESVQLWLYAPDGAVDPTLASDLETVVKQSPVVMTDDRGVQHRVIVETLDRTTMVTKQNGRGYQVSLTVRLLS